MRFSGWVVLSHAVFYTSRFQSTAVKESWPLTTTAWLPPPHPWWPLLPPPPLLRLAVEKDHLGSIHIKDPPQTLNGAIVVPPSKETEVRGGEEERKGKEDHVFT